MIKQEKMSRYSTFRPNQTHYKEQNLFLTDPVDVARYDRQKHPFFEKLIDNQVAFFWRPEEVALIQDRNDFKKLNKSERHIFLSNLKYQTLLDSVQGRAPNAVFLPIVSTPELETWVETWSFFETIHSRSYTHIIRNAIPNPEEVLDSITQTPEIQERAKSISEHYDQLYRYVSLYNVYGEGTYTIQIEKNGKKQLIEEFVTLDKIKKLIFITLHSVSALEGIRFYVSFACSFAFAERGLMSGNATIIKFIARDEALHLAGTQEMINILRTGRDDKDFIDIANDKEVIEEVEEIYNNVFKQECNWAKYLFKYGSYWGLNENILELYLKHITNVRTEKVGVRKLYEDTKNPLNWMHSKWLSFNNFANAPQEKEGTSYLSTQINHDVDAKEILNHLKSEKANQIPDINFE